MIEVGEQCGPVLTRSAADRIDDYLRSRCAIAGTTGSIGEGDHEPVVVLDHACAVLSSSTGSDNLDNVSEPAGRHADQL